MTTKPLAIAGWHRKAVNNRLAGHAVNNKLGAGPSLQFKLVIPISMEAMKMKLFVAVVMMVMAVSAVQNVAAVEAPAPSPTSDATIYVPTIVASLSAIAFGLLF
ncbi:unnamed protein product [Ilex paraguariensis]|uniref:Uncharacterized protein n=1 Tax=Ilex paraguariensis TaxID=185542 RepID=A0ABC8RY35_9AQUA